MRIRTLKKAVALAMAVLMATITGPVGLAQAKMVTTDQIIDYADTAGDRDKVEAFLLREDVRSQLVLLGIDPEEAVSRVASLSDEELQQIAGRLDELPAGQGGVVGPIVGAILIIFLVLLITDLLGLTDVFSFVNSKAK